MNAVGRNDPCPCGSGQKYKKCCLVQSAQPQPLGESHTADMVQAIKSISERRWDDAMRLLKPLLQESLDKHRVLTALASCYEGLDQYLHASEFYEKALKECPDSETYDITFRLGVARACAGRIEKAAQAFEACADLVTDEQKRAVLTNVLGLLNKIQQGQEIPESFRIVVELQKAVSELEEDRFAEAAYRLEKLAALDPDEPAIPYNLAVAYAFLKKEDQALEMFQRCVDLRPDYAQSWYNMGQICMIQKQDYSRALHYFDMAVNARPDYFSAHHQRAVALEGMGDLEGARMGYQAALEIEPNNPTAKKSLERIIQPANNQAE